jgi:nucleotide-binding universal stress UspA family protein
MPDWAPKVIVVGVDGSEQSLHAAGTAASLAGTYKATLHVVTVVRPPEGWWGIVGSPPTPAALSESLTQAQHDALDAAVGGLDLDGIDYVTSEEIGDPAHVLMAYAADAGADLLILGKRGAGLLERIVLGSVASRVAHHSPCPVMLVP